MSTVIANKIPDSQMHARRPSHKPRYVTRSTRSPFKDECEHIVLRVSVDAVPFSGDRLRSILHWCGKQKKTIPQTILVADTLIRYNNESIKGMTPTEAEDRARQQGNEWQDKYSKDIFQLRKKIDSVHIDKWNYWLNNLGFEKLFFEYQNLFKLDDKFRFSVSRDVERFVNSRRQKGLTLNWDKVYDNSVKFILEELTIHKMIYDRYKGCHAYPSDQLHCENYLVENTDFIPSRLQYPKDAYIRLKVEAKY